MRKFSELFFVVLYIVLVLAGSLAGSWFMGRTSPVRIGPTDYDLRSVQSAYRWVDPETRCEYLSGSTQSPMIPRLNREGRQICR